MRHCFLFLLEGDNTRVSIQGLALARQVLYHLSHASSVFCFTSIAGMVACLPALG
jgi:hypothetical protein